MNWEQLEKLVDGIRQEILHYKSEDKQLFASSSFQTHSLPMLHIISRIDNTIPIYFINTGFHFPETIQFRDKVVEEFGLNLLDLHSLVPKSQQRNRLGNFYFTSDPDYCCYLNKTQPMEPVLAKMDVWINGIRADQNANRRSMREEQMTPQGCLRYHPMLHWKAKLVFEYTKKYDLPKHPLDEKGYVSVGCEPCTRKFDLESERESRWFGMNKTECGLHTELIEK